MARQRRGGGFRTPEIKGTLGTLLRTTLQQAGVVRDALERGAREGRSRLDEALSGRRRRDTLADLGELVLDLIRRGEIDLAELPEAAELVAALDELDADAPPDDEPVTPPLTRRRFDSRDDGTVSSLPKPGASARAGATRATPAKPAPRVWRPVDPDAEPAAAPAPRPPRTLPRDPHRAGGISFDDDDDLADYMHPDDVPPKADP